MPSHCETQPVEHRLLGCGSDESDPVRVADFDGPLAGTFSGEAVTWLPGKPSVRRKVP